VRRIVIAVVSAGWLAGCAAAAPPAPVPQPVVEDTVAAEVSEPEIPLEERWRAPFAVQSRGQVASRGPRAHVVHSGDAPTVTAAAEPAPDTAGSAAADSAPPAPSEAKPAAPARGSSNGGAAAPAPAPRVPTPPSRGSATGTHRVATGETFYGIALRYGLSFSQLQAANPGVEPNRIRIGQELRVPRSGGASSAASSSSSRAAAARRTHTVASGETLWGIARRYGVPAERIRSANSLDGDRVRVGQTLVIPGAE
jgi:LysM repeat protein